MTKSMNPETLLTKVARLQAENTRLRRIAHHTGDAARLERTETDAKQLLVWRFSGFSISLRAVSNYGMTRRHWEWARALLIHAGIHDGRDVTCPHFAEAVTSVEDAVATLRSEGLDRLKYRLPQYSLLEGYYKKQAKLARQKARQTLCKNARQPAPFSDAHSTDNRPVGEGGSRGVRDRRAEIEARMGMDGERRGS